MLVPLQDAAAGCCRRIFLRSNRRRSVGRGEWLQRKDFCSQNTSSDHDSGYDLETHFF